MAETPEEVARRLCPRCWQHEASGCGDCTRLASALRAQYVAGLERGALASDAFDGPEAKAIGRRIRELAEQAKREGT